MSGPLSEDDLIARYFAPLAGEGAFGLKDDCATLAPPPGCEIVVKTDAIVGTVHFFADDPPDAIARKALRVNLSDLAAKGADPLGFLLTLAVPGAPDGAWLEAFAAGLGDDARTYGCPLLGGDTVRTPGPLMVSVTAFGAAPVGRMPKRTDARAGDLIYVSGTIGDAALGLQMRLAGADAPALAEQDRAFLADRYLLPRPRLALAPVVRAFAHASMDVSDGLVGDLRKMMRASGLSADVKIADVHAIAARPEWRAAAPTGGDDYEILCTIDPADAAALEAASVAAGIPVARIGVVTAGTAPAVFRDETGAEIAFPQGSFSHF